MANKPRKGKNKTAQAVESAPAPETTPQVEAAPAAEAPTQVKDAPASETTSPAAKDETLAGRIEDLALDLLGLMAEGTIHSVKNRGLEAAADGLGNIAAETREVIQENVKAVELLELAMARFDESEASLALANGTLEEVSGKLTEAEEANVGYQGIEDDLAKAKAAITAATKGAKASAANDVKLAKEQRDTAKAALKASDEAKAAAEKKLATVLSDLKVYGVGGYEDLVSMAKAVARVAELEARVAELEAGEGVDPIESGRPPMDMNVAMAALMHNAAEVGIDPKTLTSVVPRFEATLVDLLNRMVGPLVDQGLVVGSVPATIAEAAALEAAPLALVEGADPNAVLGAAVLAFEAAVLTDSSDMAERLKASVDRANNLGEMLDEREEYWRARHASLVERANNEEPDEDDLAGSRRRLVAEFGSSEDEGNVVYGRKVPTMIGWAPRELDGKVMAIAHKATIWQPFSVTIETSSGTEKATVSHVADHGDRLRLYFPDERIDRNAGHKDLLDGDAIVGLVCTPAIAADGLSPREVAVALAKARGFTDGRGSMALPKGQRHIVDTNGVALSGVPCVNLDALANHLFEEVSALAE